MRLWRHAEESGKDTELRMTAMIDVVFQLLIFFLVGTKFRVPEGELEAYLPEEGGPPKNLQELPEVDEIRVTLRVAQVTSANPYGAPSVLLDNTASKAGVRGGSMGWLERELDTLGRSKEVLENVPIIIEAEPHLAYKWVIEALDICRRTGFKKVNFAASKRNQPEGSGILKKDSG